VAGPHQGAPDQNNDLAEKLLYGPAAARAVALAE